MAKKKELNEEALAICSALKIAISLDKQANCVTHMGQLITVTPVGTVYTPFPLELNAAFRAQELYDALEGCDKPYTIIEDAAKSSINVSWGRRRATLKTIPKVSVYAPPIDPIQNPQIGPGFKELLNDYVCDLMSKSNDVSSTVVAFDGYEAYWTNRQIAAKLISNTYLPPILAFVNDLKVVTGVQGNIIGIGGTASSVTFHFDNETAVKIALADDSSINYPLGALKGLFKEDLLEASYPITDDFKEAIAYVHKFSDNVIYVSPEHVGTDEDPAIGTAVDCKDIPVSLIFFAETVKIGAFRGAEAIVKPSSGAGSIGFYPKKKDTTFAFVKVKLSN